MNLKQHYLSLLIRILDIIISIFGLILLSPIISLVYVLIYFENKSPLFLQERLGKNKTKFILIKFRTMKIDTINCATHLVNPNKVTFLGKFLRKTKLDELPQLWNVLKGNMSMVGPRPCLRSQKELITARDKYKIFKIKPGITGLAQINKIDMSEPKKLAEIELQMMKNYNLYFYFYYIFLTLIGNGTGDRVRKFSNK